MSEWEPIDSAPDDGTLVDLWADPVFGEVVGRGLRICNAKYMAGNWHISLPIAGWMPLSEGYIASHWMPLPEPPHDPQ